MILKSNKQSSADAFVFNYANECDITLSFIDLTSTNSVEKVMKLPTENNLLFLSNFQALKATEKEKLLDFIQNKNVILHTNSNTDDLKINCINLNDNEKNINSNEILTIDEYVKYVIINYQNIFPDTDLSKKLGISRKSLWEKGRNMKSARKNKNIIIDQNEFGILSLIKEGLLGTCTHLMNEKEVNEIIKSGKFKGESFPIP